MDTLTLRRPDDWHVHLRDGELMQAVLPATADTFGRALVMPNLVPPVRTAAEARAYRDRLLAAGPRPGFQPLMLGYLTDATRPEDVAEAVGTLVGYKLYPAGATTHSDRGVTSWSALRPTFEALAESGLVLCVHGEVTDRSVDVFDREVAFLERVLDPLRRQVPGLKVVFEHATTREAVDYVRAGADLAATITPHHLWWNRNALFEGGLRPHAYCLPVLKRREHQEALRAAATSGDPKFFLGTDSAPHVISRKEADCGCAGVFNAPTALPAYAQVFEDEGALDQLEAFCSLNGPRFYGLPPAEDRVVLQRKPWTPPEVWPTPGGGVKVFLGGEALRWQVVG